MARRTAAGTVASWSFISRRTSRVPMRSICADRSLRCSVGPREVSSLTLGRLSRRAGRRAVRVELEQAGRLQRQAHRALRPASPGGPSPAPAGAPSRRTAPKRERRRGRPSHSPPAVTTWKRPGPAGSRKPRREATECAARASSSPARSRIACATASPSSLAAPTQGAKRRRRPPGPTRRRPGRSGRRRPAGRSAPGRVRSEPSAARARRWPGRPPAGPPGRWRSRSLRPPGGAPSLPRGPAPRPG